MNVTGSPVSRHQEQGYREYTGCQLCHLTAWGHQETCENARGDCVNTTGIDMQLVKKLRRDHL